MCPCEFATYNRAFGLWNINELAAAVLPELPDWYDKWKNNKKTTTRRVGTAQSVMKKRLQELKDLQAGLTECDISHRTSRDYRMKLTYLFRLTAVQSGYSDSDALQEAIVYGQKFVPPLGPHDVEVECRPTSYKNKFRDATIRDMLCLTDSEFPSLFQGKGMNRKDRYQLEKKKAIQNGYITKQQKMINEWSQIQRLLSEGHTQKEIAAELSISTRTLLRRIEQYKKTPRQIPAGENKTIHMLP